MLFLKQFNRPVKIHFVSSAGTDVGSVFADFLLPHSGGAHFYFGKSCVASLNENHLVIGTRQLERAALANKRPFWYDSRETPYISPRIDLQATA